MTETDSPRVSRRRFLKGSALMTGAGALAAPQVSRAQTAALRMQSTWPEGSVFHDMAREYVTRVEEMAGRRLSVDLRAAGAVVPPWEAHEACAEGTLDAVHSASAWWTDRNPAVMLFGSGPTFGGDSAAMFAWVQRGGGHEFWDAILTEAFDRRLMGFLLFPMPNQPFGWFTTPPRTPEDLVGLRYRIPSGLPTELMREIGMTIGTMPPWEAKDAMQHGLLDGFEMNNPTLDRDFGAHEVADYYVMGSYHQTFEMFEIVFNRSRFEALPDEIRAILRYAAEATTTANLATALDRYSRDLIALMEQDGVTLERTSSEILERQLEGWDKIIEDLADNPMAVQILESQKAWCERVVFYQLMNAGDFERAYRHHFPGRLTF